MLKADKTGFFVIDVDHKKKRVILSFYTYDRKLKHRFSSDSAEALWDRVIGEQLVSDLGHSAYLGFELAKAEIALKKKVKYKQDAPIEFQERRPR